MTDKKLTDSEIVEGFEHCLKNNSCNGCVFEKTNICDSSLENKIKTLKMVDDVINRQKEEIERLQADKKSLENVIKNYFLEKAGIDIDQLAEIKSEAIKEFVVRLKEQGIKGTDVVIDDKVVFVDDIDNLVKEMVGDCNVS